MIGAAPFLVNALWSPSVHMVLTPAREVWPRPTGERTESEVAVVGSVRRRLLRGTRGLARPVADHRPLVSSGQVELFGLAGPQSAFRGPRAARPSQDRPCATRMLREASYLNDAPASPMLYCV